MKRTVGVRVDSDTRVFLDRLSGAYDIRTDAELLRVVLAAILLEGRTPEAKAAAALYTSATMSASASAGAFVASLRASLAQLAADVTSSDVRPRVPPQAQRPPGIDRSRIQTSLDTFLHRRLEKLVRLVEQLRYGVLPVTEPTERSLVRYLQDRPDILEGRYPLSEVLRWVVSVQAPQAADLGTVLDLYRRYRDVLESVIDEAFSAARVGAEDGLRRVAAAARRKAG
ncbi:MAG: hypothetical protein ABIG85_08120 [Chloroflexota bacterium]